MRHLVITMFLALLILGCQSSGPEQSATPTPTPTTPEGAVGVTEEIIRVKKSTIRTSQGQRWELQAETMDWNDERSSARASEVEWWMIDEKDKRWVKVEAPIADIDMDNDMVTFSGETLATRVGFPETLTVQHLVYKGKDRKFYGSGGVVWKRPQAELSAETLTATAELDKVQLKGRVKGRTSGGFDLLDYTSKPDGR